MDATRRRLGLALLLATLAAALFVTTYPFRFAFETGSLSRVDWRPYYPGHNNRDLIQNLLMLAPLGVGLALVRCGRASLSRIALEACALGVGTSLFVETLQIFQLGRYPQVADVWRNGAGCIAGAVLTALAPRAFAPRALARSPLSRS